MRYAVIDLGTNSARLSIHDFSRGSAELIHKEKIRVSLGSSVFKKGAVDFKRLGSTINAFEEFQERIQEFDCDRVSAMATSALREATNGIEVCYIIKKKTGINVEIISGKTEAMLIAKGVLSNEDIGTASTGLIDIGGGSTELSIWKNGQMLNCESLALGGLRFQELILKSHPPEARLIRKARQQIARVLGHRIRNWNSAKEVYGSGGTVKVIGRLIANQENEISRGDLKRLIARLSTMSLDEIVELKGMTEGKAPIILAGALILDEVMGTLGIDKVIPTPHSLRDGILTTLVERFESDNHACPISV